RPHYTQDTVSYSTPSHNKAREPAYPNFPSLSFVLFVPFVLFVALLKQTENVRGVVRPNYISLHSGPARITRDRSERGVVTRHHHPHRWILARQISLLIPANERRDAGALRQPREQRFKIQIPVTDMKRKHAVVRELAEIQIHRFGRQQMRGHRVGAEGIHDQQSVLTGRRL